MWLNVILYAVIMAGWKVYQQELFVYNEDAVHFTPIGISLLIWALSLVVIDVLVSKETVRRIDMHALSKAELNEMAKPLSLRSMLKKMAEQPIFNLLETTKARRFLYEPFVYGGPSQT